MHRCSSRPSYTRRNTNHVKEPVPFLIWYKGIQADTVQQYDEVSCTTGEYGLIELQQFMDTFMKY